MLFWNKMSVIIKAETEEIEFFTKDIAVNTVFVMISLAIFKSSCERKIFSRSAVIHSLHRSDWNNENADNNDCKNQLGAFAHDKIPPVQK